MKSPLQAAEERYSVDLAHHLLLNKTIPEDVRSKEFAEWLCKGCRMAMAEGIRIGRDEMRDAITESMVHLKESLNSQEQ